LDCASWGRQLDYLKRHAGHRSASPGRRWIVKLRIGLALSLLALCSGIAIGENTESMLQGLADLAVVTAGDWRIVSPFLYDLDPNIVADVESHYPCSGYSAVAGLSAICGYLEWVERTSDRAVIIVYVTPIPDDSCEVLNRITSVTVDGQRFKPAARPVFVELRDRSLDCTNGRCDSESFVIYAVMMGPEFLNAVNAGKTVEIVINTWGNEQSVFTMMRSDMLASYVQLLNRMAP
jgi:hypothetical protein